MTTTCLCQAPCDICLSKMTTTCLCQAPCDICLSKMTTTCLCQAPCDICLSKMTTTCLCQAPCDICLSKMTTTCLCQAPCEKSSMFLFCILLCFVSYCLFSLASITVLCVDEYDVNNFIIGHIYGRHALKT